MPVSYEIVRSNRKSIAIQIKPDGQVVVRCPKRMRLEEVRSFVESKSAWIGKHLANLPPREEKFTAQQLEALRVRTGELVTRRAEHFAQLVGVTFGRVSVRTQHSRWGSCSSKGNLNFNALLALTPPEVLDYVVVHELCHRKQMNHSLLFWAEVERILPDYRRQKQWLKEHGTKLIARLP